MCIDESGDNLGVCDGSLASVCVFLIPVAVFTNVGTSAKVEPAAGPCSVLINIIPQHFI
jgi:hypothetical protein